MADIRIKATPDEVQQALSGATPNLPNLPAIAPPIVHPPTPATAGFGAWAADPQNQAKVAGHITPPGTPLLPQPPPPAPAPAFDRSKMTPYVPSGAPPQPMASAMPPGMTLPQQSPLIPPGQAPMQSAIAAIGGLPNTPQARPKPSQMSAIGAPRQGGVTAQSRSALVPSIGPPPAQSPLLPPGYASPMQAQADWTKTNPGKQAQAIGQGKVGKGLFLAAAGLTGAAGGMHGDPSAGLNYVARVNQYNNNVPELNQQRYEAAVVKPYQQNIANQDQQAQAAERAANAPTALNPQQAQAVGRPELAGQMFTPQEVRAMLMKPPVADKPQDIKGLYAGAVQDAISRGVDPAKDPKVQQLADAQTSLQKPTASEQPLTAQEAQRLNSVWDGVAGKHHLPMGQFSEGMSRADATTLASGLNNAIGKQQGDVHITLQQQGQADRQQQQNQKSGSLDTSDPAMQQAVAAVANGSMKLQDVFGRGATTQQKAQFVAAVKQVNAGYNSGDHDIENQSRKYFVAGQGGQTLNAGQTLTHHIDLYDKAVDAVHNGDVKAVNMIGNELGTQLGSDAQTNLNLIRQGVAMEAARFYTGGVPGEAEINQFNKSLSGDGSPAQMHGGANTIRAMARGKMQSLQSQAAAGAKGQANFGSSSAGGSYLKTATGPNGHKIGLRDSKWYDVQTGQEVR